ncbi:MAG: hypothetical protein PUI16_04155 [Clostridia bacterium]|nr:hypothetical protein [Clostridia bacterium]MDY5555169.1 hypothetical protein [Blautia sp.]
MTYEQLLDTAEKNGLEVKGQPIIEYDGLIRNNRIAIRKNIETDAEKSCVLAEKLGHYYTSSGNIIDLQDARNQKQERKAEKLIDKFSLGSISYENGRQFEDFLSQCYYRTEFYYHKRIR